jgi:hypothetical protein
MGRKDFALPLRPDLQENIDTFFRIAAFIAHRFSPRHGWNSAWMRLGVSGIRTAVAPAGPRA